MEAGDNEQAYNLLKQRLSKIQNSNWQTLSVQHGKIKSEYLKWDDEVPTIAETNTIFDDVRLQDVNNDE